MAVAISGLPTQDRSRARTGQESDFPNLWKNLVAAYVPSLGPNPTTLYDAGIGKHNGTLTNSPTFTAGKFGYALTLASASSQYVNIPDQAALSVTNKFTLAVWVKFATLTTSTSYMILSKNSGTTKNFWLYGQGASPNAITIQGNGSQVVNSSGSFLNTNTWYFITATYDGTTTKLYVNGEFNNSGTNPAYSTTTTPLRIGITNELTAPFDGQIGTVLIYGRALTKSEVKQLMVASNSMFLIPSRLRRELEKVHTIATIQSDTEILKVQTQDTTSDTTIVPLGVQTISSNADIEATTVQDIYSSAQIFKTQQVSILSDTDILKTTIQTKLSNALVVLTQVKTIFSNTDIFRTQTTTISSSTDIKVTQTKTTASNADIFGTTAQQIASDTIIFRPLDLNCEASFTKNSQKDFYIQSEVIYVIPDVPFNVMIANTGSGDAVRIEWDGTAPFYNVYMVTLGPTYIKMNAYLISSHFYVVGGLQENTAYTFMVRGANGQG